MLIASHEGSAGPGDGEGKRLPVHGTEVELTGSVGEWERRIQKTANSATRGYLILCDSHKITHQVGRAVTSIY